MEKKINGTTCKPVDEEMLEVQRKLRAKETQKARGLLTLAMSHYEAMQFMKKKIEQEVQDKKKQR